MMVIIMIRKNARRRQSAVPTFQFLNEKVKNDHLFGYAKKQQEQQQKAMAQMFTSMQQQQ